MSPNYAKRSILSIKLKNWVWAQKTLESEIEAKNALKISLSLKKWARAQRMSQSIKCLTNRRSSHLLDLFVHYLTNWRQHYVLDELTVDSWLNEALWIDKLSIEGQASLFCPISNHLKRLQVWTPPLAFFFLLEKCDKCEMRWKKCADKSHQRLNKDAFWGCIHKMN